jgi:hypothetical protein
MLPFMEGVPVNITAFDKVAAESAKPAGLKAGSKVPAKAAIELGGRNKRDGNPG